MYLRLSVYFQNFSFAPSVYLNLCTQTCTFLIDIISEYHAYKTIWMLFIIKLDSLFAASSYQEWFQVKARASKQDQTFIFYNTQTLWLIIETIFIQIRFSFEEMQYIIIIL